MQTKANLFYYSLLSAILLVMEILIGKFVPSGTLLRDYGGDILVIPLIYCLIRIFVKILPKAMPLLVCGIGFFAEITQYFHLSDRLGFTRGSLMSILLGTSFSWLDLLCYLIGMLLIYAGILLKSKCNHNF
ncbi:MAG: DUF2809 domain-containing protein [Oscillospiraceae bacterium]|nr:DUF2809 domain-containing protein [Oscillospiraceae bacterium]